jgi:ERCC4-type nuclease
VDSREKTRAIRKIIAEFEKQKVKHYISKLYVGDYMSLDNPRLIIDRKQNLTEVCANVCQGHERFRNELIRAKEHGIKLIILVEHSNQIKSIEDVASWINPRLKASNKAMTGETLSKIMTTMERKYGCEFMFCDKLHTGKRIIEILGGDPG